MVLAPITVELMRAVDRLMVDDYGITLVQMMKNAGRSLAALTRMLHGGDTASARVLVLVGTGNNGGGGPAPPRHPAHSPAGVRGAPVSSPPPPRGVPRRPRAPPHAPGGAGSHAAAALVRVPS